MKAAVAGFTVVILAMVAAFVFAYAGNRDTTPDDLTSCAQDLGLGRIISTGALGPAVPDLETGSLAATDRFALKGGTFATLLAPPDRAYTLLVVTKRPASVAAVRQRISTAPENEVFVALSESPPISRALRVCVTDLRASAN